MLVIEIIFIIISYILALLLEIGKYLLIGSFLFILVAAEWALIMAESDYRTER